MMKGQIAKGAVISYVSIFLNIAISFFYTPWMIKQIGISDYALYSLVSSFISYFLLDLGLSMSISRFVAKYRAQNDEEKVRQLLGLAIKVYLVIDALIFIALMVAFLFISDIFRGLTPVEIERLQKLFVIAGGFSIISFALKPIDGVMMAYEYFVPNKILDMVNRVGSVTLIVILLALHGDIFILVLVQGVVVFVVSIIKWLFFLRKSKIIIKWNYFNLSEMKILFSFSVWIFVISLAQRFRLSLNPSILGIVSNSVEIAVFSIGMLIEGLVWTISNALNGMFLPRVTKMSVEGKINQISSLMTRVGRLQLYLTLLIFIVFFAFGKSFVNLWVGGEMSDAYYVILLLIVTALISNTQTIANDLVYAENKVKSTSIMIFVSSSIGLIMALLLSKKLGAVGCAFSTCVGLIVYIIMVNIFYHRKMGIDMIAFFMNVHISIIPKLMIPIAISFFCAFIPIENWLVLFGAILSYCIFYILFCYFFSFNDEEKKIVLSLVKK